MGCDVVAEEVAGVVKLNIGAGGDVTVGATTAVVLPKLKVVLAEVVVAPKGKPVDGAADVGGVMVKPPEVTPAVGVAPKLSVLADVLLVTAAPKAGAAGAVV